MNVSRIVAGRSRQQPDLSRQEFERILLIKPSSLGDIVHALPVLHGLKARYPRAKIDWLVGASFAALLENHPEISELVLFDRRRMGRIGRSPRVVGELLAFLRDLRARKYDLVIDLQGLFRSGFFSRATGAPIRLGFDNAREGATLFYTHRLVVEDPDAHAVDRNYLAATALGFADVPVTFTLDLPESAEEEARSLLTTCGISGSNLLVAVVPGARWATKAWPAERFAEAVDRLTESAGMRCVLLGSPDEASLCARVAELSRTAPVDLAGRTGLILFAAIVKMADVVICLDSAAVHIAVAFDRPLVCLIGPTNPGRTGPYGRPEDVVRLNLDCSPCYLRRLTQCPYSHRCMQDLSVEQVVAAVRQAISRATVTKGAG